MSYIHFIKPGMHTSIQDAGRKNCAFYGIPESGYMDTRSANMANYLVGNPEGNSLVECSYIGPKIDFGRNFIVALTGADMNWKVDGNPVPRYTSLYIRRGSVLSGTAAVNGVRSYIAIQGKWMVDKDFGSSSTYVNAGYGAQKGQLIQKGDKLTFDKHKSKWDFRYIADEERPRLQSVKYIPLHRGPDWHLLDQRSKECFIKDKWTISSDSDRMAAPLLGHHITVKLRAELKSAPVFPGIIQLPNDGNPILLLQDCQTTGGYPRIAYVPKKSLSLFNQIRPDEEFYFYFVPDIK
jgi:antagonist of KipI